MTAWYDFPVTNGYSTKKIDGNFDTPHYAEDIATPFHTPITAIEAGTVKQADYAAWGGEVFIVPDDGSATYYFYHLDQNNVVPGQKVKPGDIIGLSGGENAAFPGALHPTQPAYSTGPHTHVGLFTGWTTGPTGTIPYGPDISPLLQAIKVGKIPVPTADAGTEAIAAHGGIAISDWSHGIQSGLMKAALFLVGLIFLSGGLYIMFKDPINKVVVEGTKTAVKVAML